MPGWTTGLIIFSVMAFLGLLMAAAQRGRPRVDPQTGSLLFQHSWLFRGFSLFMAIGVPIGLTALVLFHPPKNNGDLAAILGLFGGFAALIAPLLWESLRFGLVVSPTGLDCRSPWRRGRFIPWGEVKELSYSAVNSWFIIHASDGWKFRVSILVAGIGEFLAQCEQRLPPAALLPANEGYTRLGRPFPR
jgi:hypothetical protein